MDFIYSALTAQANFTNLMVMLLEDLPLSALRRFLVKAEKSGELKEGLVTALDHTVAGYQRLLRENGYIITSENGQYYWTLPNGEAGENWYEHIDAVMDAWDTYKAKQSPQSDLPDVTHF